MHIDYNRRFVLQEIELKTSRMFIEFVNALRMKREEDLANLLDIMPPPPMYPHWPSLTPNGPLPLKRTGTGAIMAPDPLHEHAPLDSHVGTGAIAAPHYVLEDPNPDPPPPYTA